MVCTATEGSCPLWETCLRSKTLRETDYTSARAGRMLPVVNLWNSALKPLTAECEMYREAVAQRFAKGFQNLLGTVPKGIYGEVQERLMRVFTSKRVYYYCRNGTYLTSPEEQQQIKRILEKHGVAATTEFDEYVEVYDWS